jgi:4-amino-4-deoxy-L-arabinose transferase-like glycosyltransferase
VARFQRVALVLILVAAAALRLTGLDWDGFQHHHPDERYIAWVATTIEFPSIQTSDWAAQWRPRTSTFNPFYWPPAAASEGIVVLQDEPRDFAYGHVPLYLGVLATRLAERVAPLLLPLMPPNWSLAADVLNGAGRVEFHHLTAVGRALTALFDVGTVWLTFLIGRRLYGPAVGLLAAALLAVTVLHVQLAHFFISDPYLTFFAVAALYFMVAGQMVDPNRRPRAFLYLVLAAVMVGLAVGSKFTAVLLVLPLVWTTTTVISGPRRWLATVALLAIVFVTFALTNPFAILDWTCSPAESPLAFLSRSCYLQNVMTQSAMVRGRADLGFTRQFAGTWPYLYFIEMLLRWGMGLALGLLGMAGLGWVVWHVARSVRDESGRRGAIHRLQSQPVFTLLLWVLPYFILTGSFYVKFVRYMQPIIPLLILFGAAMIWQWRSIAGRSAVAGAILLVTSLYAFAFIAIYDAEHPWNAASRWIHENVPPGTLILSEQWDDYLPATMRLGDTIHRREEYRNAELTWLTSPDAGDDEEKLAANLDLLAEAEYLTVLSNRVYGVAPRLPERYPISGQYHQLLFDGALGYEPVWVGERTPRLFGRALRADTFGWPGLRPPQAVADYLARNKGVSLGRADESFIVYDQPLTMILRNTGHLTAAEMRAAFDLPDE